MEANAGSEPARIRESLAGKGATRLEGFSDAVFGFALTLLVVSLEVPRTFTDLTTMMRGVLPFGLCFASLIYIWREHCRFFRRYHLETPFVVVVNATLLFTVLLYVYPLKFLFSLLFNLFTGGGLTVPHTSGEPIPVIGNRDMPTLLIIYGAGFIAVEGLLMVLFTYGYHKRKELAMNQLELYDTVSSIQMHLICVAYGILSVLIAAVRFNYSSAAAGLIYPLMMSPTLGVHGFLRGKWRDDVERALHKEGT